MVGYDFYKGQYGGQSIASPCDWLEFKKRAEEQLQRYKRVYTVTAPDEIAEKMAICAMADTLYFFANAQSGGAVASASIGSVSVNYGTQNAVDLSPKAQERELYRCASLYLEIYRGVS